MATPRKNPPPYGVKGRQKRRKHPEDWKWCSMCEQMRPPSEFYLREEGSMTLSTFCKTHQNEYAQEQRRAWKLNPEVRAALAAQSRRTALKMKKRRRADKEHRTNATLRMIKLLKQHGWTQRQISSETGTSQATISNWVRRASSPTYASYSNVRRLCDRLGLLGGVEEDNETIRSTSLEESLTDWEVPKDDQGPADAERLEAQWLQPARRS
jgi:transcriptional regulator with XRE-family HTH domain